MDEVREYFVCDKCGNKDFFLRISFAINFRNTNFSDGLIYERPVEECYECSGCGVCLTREEIEAGIESIKRKYKDENNLS